MSHEELEASRRRFEQSLRGVQESLSLELGGRRGGRRRWILPLIGLGAGLALAWKLMRRRQRRRADG